MPIAVVVPDRMAPVYVVFNCNAYIPFLALGVCPPLAPFSEQTSDFWTAVMTASAVLVRTLALLG